MITTITKSIATLSIFWRSRLESIFGAIQAAQTGPVVLNFIDWTIGRHHLDIIYKGTITRKNP